MEFILQLMCHLESCDEEERIDFILYFFWHNVITLQRKAAK